VAWGCDLCENGIHHTTCNVGESKTPAAVAIGEFVVDCQQAQNCSVQIVDVKFVLNDWPEISLPRKAGRCVLSVRGNTFGILQIVMTLRLRRTILRLTW